MKPLATSIALLGVMIAACSAPDPEQPTPSESIAQTSEPITASCTTQTLGMVCDPDGPTGVLQECQGVCFISSTTGLPACLATSNTAGRSCGSTNGVGAAACQFHCQGGSCIPGPAAGAACRLTANDSPCSGACSNAGACDPVPSECKYGVDGCVLSFCNAANATQCIKQNLTASTPCDDSNDCTIGDKCAAGGVCSAGGPKACSDFNGCTDDTCAPATGACVHTPNTATCSDNNACTEGDTCSGGLCKAGTGTKNCDDNSLCTTDSCNAQTGCVNAAKNCSDNDTCTTDSCDATSGICSNTPIPGCGIDSGTGGAGGAAGTGGTAGSSAGGSAGTAGAGGGAAGAGGVAGSGTGGVAGAATGGTAGAVTGGSGGSTGGTGGSSTGGTSTGGTSTGGTSSGGTSAGGSGAVDAGVGGKKSFETTEDDGGCGCRVPQRSDSSTSLVALLGFAATILARRRKR